MPAGGAITLNGKKSNSFKKILNSRRWNGISNRHGTKYDIKEIGWNYYMNEFSAAIGIEQLKKQNALTTKRKKIAKRYEQEINLKNKMPFVDGCSYHLYWILVKKRGKFIKKMNDKNIEIGIHYKPVHQMTLYKNLARLPITEKIGKQIVSLPIHPNLTESQIDYIIKTINEFS